MKIFLNIITVALRSIMKNKRRNIFTMIGITIGIAAVITILSLGEGFQQTVSDELESTGSSPVSAIISFTPDNVSEPIENPFSDADINLISQTDGVSNTEISNDDSQGFSAEATTVSNQSEINIIKNNEMQNVRTGEGFTQIDNELRNRVIVVDETVSEELFNNNPIGETLYINNTGFKIIGIAEGTSTLSEVNIPDHTFDFYLSDLTQNFPQLQINITEESNKNNIANEVVEQLNNRGSESSNGVYDYIDMGEMAQGTDQLLAAITYFVAAVAGISLFIAGVGVMNVMYISVAERTEEIAIRRAFGAKVRDIELQFLTEGVILSLIGGITGLLLGVFSSIALDVLTPEYIQSVITLSSVLLSVGVSILIGIVFSLVPAQTAAKKELIDIIK